MAEKSKIFNLWLMVVSALLGVLFTLTPPGFDDYTYLLGSNQSMSAIETATVVWRNCTVHWMTDTGRLANLLLPLFLGMLPKWVFAAISSVMFYICITTMCNLANVARGSVYSWLIMVPVIFILPWFDYMLTTVFAINYLWPSALSLILLYILKNHLYDSGGAMKLTGLCLFSATAGWMHEGFTVPVIAGLTAVYIFMRKAPSPREAVVLASYVIGGALIAVAPAFWHRAAAQQSLFMRLTAFELMIHGVAFNIMYLIMILLLTVVVSKRHYRSMLVSNRQAVSLTIFTIVSTTVASVIYYKFYAGPRMGWYSTLFCTILFAGIGHLIKPRVKRESRRVIAWIVLLIVPVHLSCAIAEQHVLCKENDDIVALYLKSPDGEVYCDNSPIGITAGLMKTSVRNFNEYAPTALFSAYWNNGTRETMLSLLPEKLNRFSPARITPCESDSTLFLFENALVCRDSVPDEFARIMVKTSEMGWVESRMRPRTFHPAADSSTWVLVVPHISAMTRCEISDARWIR